MSRMYRSRSVLSKPAPKNNISSTIPNAGSRSMAATTPGVVGRAVTSTGGGIGVDRNGGGVATGYFSDPDMETNFRKDTDWFSTYISHLRKRRRKTIKGTRISLDEESDDDVVGYATRDASKTATDRLKGRTFYEKQQDKKSRSKISEAPENYWTYFRQYGGSKPGDSGPSPNEVRYSESGLKRMNDEREKTGNYKSSHSHKDLFGAEEYYKSGRDVLYRIWQERENLKERDRQLKQELGYDEREMELGAPRLVHDSRETTMRYTTPLHNPNSQHLVRTIVTEPGRPHSAMPSTKAASAGAGLNNNLTKYSTGTGLDLTRVTSQKAMTADQRSMAPSQRPFEIPDIDTEDRENFGQSTMLKQKIDTQQRKMENLYDTIRSLEREKSNQEHVLQDLKEDMRSMREKMEVSTSGRSLAHQGDHPAALAAAAAAGNNSRQLELFRNEFMDQFAKMQHQINGLSSHQHKSMKSEDLITSLVSDIGDIKKLFRDEISTLRQDMEDVKSQNRKIASTFESNSAQMRELQKKISYVEKRCDDVAHTSSKMMRDSSISGPERLLKSTSSLSNNDTPAVPPANFELNELKSTLMLLDSRVKQMEQTSAEVVADRGLEDYHNLRHEKSRFGLHSKEDNFPNMGAGESNFGQRKDFESKEGEGEKRVTAGAYDSGEIGPSGLQSRWNKLPLTSDFDLDFASPTQGEQEDRLRQPDRRRGDRIRSESGVSSQNGNNQLDRQSSTTTAQGLGSAEDLLLLTEEMDLDLEVPDVNLEGVGAGAVSAHLDAAADLTSSEINSLDDLSTF
ncbi:uncharacterized protein LOC142344039 isoform X2 [Convolutriloba macropyga]|uniref:uncharacterized protein LOC142344039 isoform X2 n=1 Tax=Convolutriloba macropyga TaxID=536237 RepID=UPI003F52324E